MGRRFTRESRVGKGPVEGEGARFVPPAVLTAWCGLSQSLSLCCSGKTNKQTNKDAQEVEKRGQRGWLPLELCAATRLGPLV